MSTNTKWWSGSALVETDLPEPIPFPSRRARMTLRPPHEMAEEQVTDENIRSADFAAQALQAVEDVSRRMNILARELDCLGFYDDGEDDNFTPPSAA